LGFDAALRVGFEWEQPVSGTQAERTAEGTVVELLPSALVRVRLEGEHEAVAHMPSSQRANFVRLRVGDRVLVAVSVTGHAAGF